MTLMLDLSSAEEARLAAAAQQAGLAPDALLRTLVNRLPLPAGTPASPNTSAIDAREQAIRAGRGSMAHHSASVQDLHQQRQLDKRREQAQGLDS